ncbi:UNVERIFIED_CONTAM: hypothetical protein Sradi_3605500 [Sesamum radiatum]|uniref:Uncharacterized protein n=1 Tax=Sesamum radiatum TaxID=300843 RepID=A0AAW2QGZ2_SESRA
MAAERQKKRFCFEAMWFRSPHCENVIRSAWGSVDASNPNLAVWEKIKNCRIELLKWERIDFENMKRRIKETEERIAGKQQGKFDEATNNEVQMLRRQLKEFRSNENMMW